MTAAKNTLDTLLQSHLDAFRTAVPTQDCHTVHNSFEAIFSSNDSDRADCESAWKDLVRYICSIPDKYARMGDQYEIETMAFAYGELLSKICKRGHSSESQSIVPDLYTMLRTHLPTTSSSSYCTIWQQTIHSFQPLALELFLTSFLIYCQETVLSSISSTLIDDKSRSKVLKTAQLLKLIIGDINGEQLAYLLKYKYFVGGVLFENSILRVLCCFLSWGTTINNAVGMEEKTSILGKYKVDLSVDSELVQLLKTLLSAWSDPTFVKHGSTRSHLYLTNAILIIFGYLPKEVLIDAGISKILATGVTHWLGGSFTESRKIGMVTAETLSQLTDGPDKALDFGLASDDEFVNQLRIISKARDAFVEEAYDEENEKEAMGEIKQENSQTASTQIIPASSVNAPTHTTAKSGSIIQQIPDSDDEDDFVPYPMEEEIDSESSDVEFSMREKGKKLTVPIYLRDLIGYLKSHEEPNKIEIALKHASELICKKSTFGTELDEHAIDLATVLMSIQDSYKIKGFEESRNAALVALGCGSPKIVIPYLIQYLVEKQLSIAQRFTILDVIAKCAREISGIKSQESMPADKKYALDTVSRQPTGDSLDAIQQMSVPVGKITRLSKRPQIEVARAKSVSVNRFDELAYKTFFAPLATGWWSWARDRSRTQLVYEPLLIQKVITTLAVIVECSIREFWDLILSIRYYSDPIVQGSILYSLSIILNMVAKRDIAELHGKELIESQEWVTSVFEKLEDERLKSMAALILVRIKNIVGEYQRLLIGELLPVV
ncbi:6417_t:CDS:10 [Paraglomus occultum]|uniref:6417_t:CDS:1 n=1 Tax=Paraglomus occultum TaxID=144539 RepID=A0A9N9FKM6_9GLOM|nr:6417_t:CDS:10 [Paraglomus occultum]